jgi:hypothetical protein
MLKLSNRQTNRLIAHLTEATSILMDAAGIEPETEMAAGPRFEDLPRRKMELEVELEFEAVGSDCPFEGTASKPGGFCHNDNDGSVGGREAEMSRLCGRWTAGENRGGVEISRRGEHLVLRYLKRSGQPFGDRFVLLWFDDGSHIFYGHGDRTTSVTLDTETDTLMLSPGVDYTRIKR